MEPTDTLNKLGFRQSPTWAFEYCKDLTVSGHSAKLTVNLISKVVGYTKFVAGYSLLVWTQEFESNEDLYEILKIYLK